MINRNGSRGIWLARNNLVQHKLWAKQGFFCSINVYCFFFFNYSIYRQHGSFLGLTAQSETALGTSTEARRRAGWRAARRRARTLQPGSLFFTQREHL